MRRLVALLATTARAQTPRRVHGFDVRTKAGHAFKCLDVFIAPAPWNASAPALIGVCHPGHRQLTWAGGRCGFRYASTATNAREKYGALGAGRGETLRRRVQALL